MAYEYVNCEDGINIFVECALNEEGNPEGFTGELLFKSLKFNEDGHLMRISSARNGCGVYAGCVVRPEVGKFLLRLTNRQNNEELVLELNDKPYANLVRISVLRRWFGVCDEEDVERVATDMPDIF